MVITHGGSRRISKGTERVFFERTKVLQHPGASVWISKRTLQKKKNLKPHLPAVFIK